VRCKKGILLLEVMVSIVVITAGLLFVMRVYSTAKEALQRSRDFFKYSLLLEDRMYDFEEKGVIEEGRDKGRFPSLREYYWEVSADSLAFEEQELSDLCSVRMDVFYRASSAQAEKSDKYSLFTYLFKKR